MVSNQETIFRSQEISLAQRLAVGVYPGVDSGLTGVDQDGVDLGLTNGIDHGIDPGLTNWIDHGIDPGLTTGLTRG